MQNNDNSNHENNQSSKKSSLGKHVELEKRFKSPYTRKETIGRYAIVPEFFLYYGKHLSPPAKWVYTVLLMHWNNDNFDCFPSVASIAKISGISETTVKTALNELEFFGWLAREERTRKNIKGRASKQKSLTYPTKTVAVNAAKLPDHLKKYPVAERTVPCISPTEAQANAKEWKKKKPKSEMVAEIEIETATEKFETEFNYRINEYNRTGNFDSLINHEFDEPF